MGAVASDTVQSWDYAEGALVRHTTTTVDGVDETVIRRDEDGRIGAILANGTETRFAYDSACQLERSLRGDAEASQWRYDLAGRLVAESIEGVATEFAYDAAGQLRSRTSDAGTTTYAYDGLGRRTAVVDADGSARNFEWSDRGWLSAVVSEGSAGAASRSELWVDALGELGDVDGTEVWWDSAEVAPRVLALGGKSVVALPGGMAAVGETVLNAGWRSGHTTDASSPWGMSAGAVAGLPAGLSVSASGGVQVAGLDWFGTRAYDPLTRGFLSVDPLDPVVGAGWAGNPYSYAGNDPLHAIDPLGLSPVSEADLQAYRDGNNGAFAAAGDFLAENWEYFAGGAAVIAGGALMIFGGPIGAVAGGMLISAGAQTIMEKAQKGTVNWGNVAVAGAMGAVGGGAGVLATRAATVGVGAAAASSTSRFLAAASVNAGVNGTFGAVGGGVSELMKNDWTIKNGWKFAGALGGGFVAGTIGGIAGQSGGTIARSLGQSSTGLLARGSTVVISAGGGAAGSMTSDLMAGGNINLHNAGISALSGGAASAIPIDKIPGFGGMNGVGTLRQMPNFHPRTFAGSFDFARPNTSGMWTNAGSSALAGFGMDQFSEGLKK